MEDAYIISVLVNMRVSESATGEAVGGMGGGGEAGKKRGFGGRNNDGRARRLGREGIL